MDGWMDGWIDINAPRLYLEREGERERRREGEIDIDINAPHQGVVHGDILDI